MERRIKKVNCKQNTDLYLDEMTKTIVMSLVFFFLLYLNEIDFSPRVLCVCLFGAVRNGSLNSGCMRVIMSLFS